MNQQPNEILLMIFNYVSGDWLSIIRSRRICQKWKNLIDSSKVPSKNVFDCIINDKVLEFNKYISSVSNEITIFTKDDNCNMSRRNIMIYSFELKKNNFMANCLSIENMKTHEIPINDYLEWAAENGHLEVVRFLIESGANIHAENDYALRWAVFLYLYFAEQNKILGTHSVACILQSRIHRNCLQWAY